MTDATSNGALLAAPPRPEPPATQMIVDVARQFGVSPLRQFGEMMRLGAGRKNIDFNEYYSNQVYRVDLSFSDKKSFVGKKGSFRLNLRLSPYQVTGLRPFVRDKVLYAAVMNQFGFAVPQMQAVFAEDRHYGTLAVLKTAEDIETFMLEDAEYPLFVKPEEGSGSVGSALISEIDSDSRELLLSNGKRVDLRAFANEVVRDYGEGFLFQDAVRQHRLLTEVAGQAVGSIRVVTVNDGSGPTCLYALWKIPSPRAMSDNYWQPGSMLAEIDKSSGRVLQCRRGSGPDQEMLDRHPVSGVVFSGMQIPHWDAVLRLASDAHAMMPKFGVIGWDIAITEDSPVIIESNANPHHMLYQLSTGRGILSAEFKPVFDRVAERAAAHIQVWKAHRRAERKGK